MRAAVGFFAIVLAGCGYVGDPLPPALNIPVAPENFRAIQLAGKIVVEFRQSALTTEGLVLAKLGPPQLEAGGEVFEIPNTSPGPVRFEIDAGKWIGQSIRARVRVNNGRGRYSEWSTGSQLDVVEPLKVPAAVRAESVGDGVKLSWEPPENRAGLKWLVTRSSREGEKRFEASGEPFIDTDAKLGVEYSYRLQGVLGSAQSLPSEAVAHVHVDRKAPAAPSGLSASVTLDGVELTWSRNADGDVANYRVYRDAGDGWKVLVDLITLPAFGDRTTERGKHYRYRVTAIDKSGNESEPSNVVTVQSSSSAAGLGAKVFRGASEGI
jgi:hypothetical protein